MQSRRFYKIVGAVIAGIILIIGLLAYYQQQGFIKVFPSAEDRENKRILSIDRSLFSPPQGLPAEKFEEEIGKLQQQREAVLKNPSDSTAWFAFGYTKNFLNDHAGAVAAWEKAYQLQTGNFVTTANLANTYQYFLKDFPKAEQYYLKTIQIKPDMTAAYTGLLDLYEFNMKEKQNQLEPLVLQAAKSDPGNQIAYFSTLTEYFAKSGNIAKAKEYLAKIRQLSAEKYSDLIEAYPALK